MRYTIQSVSALLGVSQSTIRRYEDRGLVKIERNNENNYRTYSFTDVMQLSICLCMQRQMLTSDRIMEFKESDNIQQSIQQSHARIEEINETIVRLQAIRMCWEDQIELARLIQRIQEHPLQAVTVEYPELLIDLLEGDYANESMYFSMVREKSEAVYAFRPCCLISKKDLQESNPQYKQACIVPVNRVDSSLSDSYDAVQRVPSRKYLAMHDENCMMLEEDEEESTARCADIIKRIHLVLQQTNQKACGDVILLKYTIISNVTQPIILIPIKE